MLSLLCVAFSGCSERGCSLAVVSALSAACGFLWLQRAGLLSLAVVRALTAVASPAAERAGVSSCGG